MQEQTKQSHLLVPSTSTLAGMTAFMTFFILALYLSVNIILKRSCPFTLLVWLYVLCLLTNEFFFWKDWKKRISKSLKTQNWSLSLKNHANLWLALGWIIFDNLTDIFLIKNALNLKTPIIWAFVALIFSKSLGSLIQYCGCHIIGRRNTMLFSFSILLCIMFFLSKESLSFYFLFSLIIIKGLFVNLTTIAKTVIADQIEIKY